MLEKLYTRVAPEETYEVRVRQRTEDSVPILLRQDETTRPRLQTHPSVSSGSDGLRHRS